MSGIVGWLKPTSLSEFEHLSDTIRHRGTPQRTQFESLWMELRSHSAIQSYNTPEVWLGLIGDLYSHNATELPSLWTQNGAQIFSKVEGSFVLVIWEKKEKKLQKKIVSWAETGQSFFLRSGSKILVVVERER